MTELTPELIYDEANAWLQEHDAIDDDTSVVESFENEFLDELESFFDGPEYHKTSNPFPYIDYADSRDYRIIDVSEREPYYIDLFVNKGAPILVIADDPEAIYECWKKAFYEDYLPEKSEDSKIVTDGGVKPDKGEYSHSLDPGTEHIHIVDGSPRLTHKTTNIVHAAWELYEDGEAGVPVIIENNYEKAHETATNHLAGGKYGVNAGTVVIPKGKDKATEWCPDDCDHELDGSNFGKVRAKAREVASGTRVVMPQIFRGSEVCAYHATKAAVEFADAVLMHGTMFNRMCDAGSFPDAYQVIIDEESTQDYFRPSASKIGEIVPRKGDFGPPCTVEFDIGPDNISNVARRENKKIDDLDRVSWRYKNVSNACDWAAEVLEEVRDFDMMDPPRNPSFYGKTEWEEHDKPEDEGFLYRMYLEHCVDPGEIDLEGPDSEKSATFDRIRMNYHRFNGAQMLESAFFEPELQVTPSGNKYDIRIVPNPTADYLVKRETFRDADKVWLVGDLAARDFAEKIGTNFDYTCLKARKPDLDDLKILSVRCGEETTEYQRRAFMTDVSKDLAEERISHPLFAGSGKRAQQAAERIGPPSYFFNAAAERRHYKEVSDIGYAITSYPGSRISRGIDLGTQVSIVRSTQFQSGVWDYEGSDDDESLKCSRMRRYSKEIEVHNMMLRGAGQGQKHVAVVPSMTPFFGLLDQITEFSVSDGVDAVIEAILGHLAGVDTDDEVYWDGDTGYVSMTEWLENRRSQGDEPD